MIFLHIHRTGGSTLWHTLSNAATRQNHQVIDLYYESWAAFQNPFSTVDAIEKMNADGRQINWNDDALLIHHHTRQNIGNSLPSEALYYATIIRDPVDRFISEVFHIRKLLMEGAELTEEFSFYGGEFTWYREVLGESLYTMFMQETVDPDELLIAASKCPYYQNFYFNVFWSALINDQSTFTPTYRPSNITEGQRHKLVTAVREKFAYIGRYPQLKRAISAVAYLSGLSINPDADLVHVKNASNKPDIRPETLAILRKANEDEYLLLEMLEAPSARERVLERRGHEEQSKREIISQDFEHLQREFNAVQQALQHTSDELQNVQSHAEKLHLELNQAQTLAETLQIKSSQAQTLAETLQIKLTHAQDHIEQLHHSKSWRVTAPFRSILRLVRQR
ncbi:hypothetical protein LRS56_05320 [Pseudomonas poae]|nr:hypothetical protein LRS56_05320 [Pseudomonas poae]